MQQFSIPHLKSLWPQGELNAKEGEPHAEALLLENASQTGDQSVIVFCVSLSK